MFSKKYGVRPNAALRTFCIRLTVSSSDRRCSRRCNRRCNRSCNRRERGDSQLLRLRERL